MTANRRLPSGSCRLSDGDPLSKRRSVRPTRAAGHAQRVDQLLVAVGDRRGPLLAAVGPGDPHVGVAVGVDVLDRLVVEQPLQRAQAEQGVVDRLGEGGLLLEREGLEPGLELLLGVALEAAVDELAAVLALVGGRHAGAGRPARRPAGARSARRPPRAGSSRTSGLVSAFTGRRSSAASRRKCLGRGGGRSRRRSVGMRPRPSGPRVAGDRTAGAAGRRALGGRRVRRRGQPWPGAIRAAAGRAGGWDVGGA